MLKLVKMSDEENSKILCKYGVECYQKNPTHLAKYKHPKKRSSSPDENISKKLKTISTSEYKIDKLTRENTDDDSVSKLNLEDDIEDESLDKKKCLIKDFFLVDMPEDFYHFWAFCKVLDSENPKNALKLIDLLLVGPYDVLASKIVKNKEEQHLLHYRYYFDPPEFQTVLKGADKTEHHIGYYRDTPGKPCFLADNHAKKDCILKPIGENIFGATNTYIESLLLKADPFRRMGIIKLQKRIKEKARDLNYDINKITSAMEKRQHAVVSKTFHTAGIVVPYDRKTDVGYRPLQVTNKELIKLCDRISKASSESKSKVMSELQPIVTAATIAIDECDFGTGLELGINLFCYGNENLDSISLRMLTSAYSVLNRDAFIEIAKAHLGNRKKGFPYVAKYE